MVSHMRVERGRAVELIRYLGHELVGCEEVALLERCGMADDFTENLRWLFDHVPGPDGRRITTERLVAMVNELDPTVGMSTSYGHQLRRGAKANPSATIAAAIARAFGMPAAYFLDDAVRSTIQTGVANLHVAKSDAIAQIQNQLESLTPAQLAQLLSLVDAFTASGSDQPKA